MSDAGANALSPNLVNVIGGRVQQRLEQVGCQVVETVRQRPEEPLPGITVGAEPGRRVGDGPMQHPGAAVVEGLNRIDLRILPRQSVGLEIETREER